MYWYIAYIIIGLVVAATLAAIAYSNQTSKNQQLNTPQLTQPIPTNDIQQERLRNLNQHRRTQNAALSQEEIKAKLEIAQAYEIEKNGLKRQPQKAFESYLELAQMGVKEALPALDRLGEELTANEQLKLSQLYSFFRNPVKANYWQDKANEVSNFQFS